MKNKIIIISGDPNSINSEIILKSWKYLSDKTVVTLNFEKNQSNFQQDLSFHVKTKKQLKFIKKKCI